MTDEGSDVRHAGLDHLVPAARAMIEKPREERIRFAQRDRWLEYPVATRAINDLSDLLDKPKQGRARGILVLGRPDNGKSALLRRFAHLHQAASLDDGSTTQPVVFMSFPDDSREDKFWSGLLVALRIPHRVTDPSKLHKAQATEVLRAIGARMLLIDEIHNLLEGGGRQQSHALVALKTLANDLSLHLVVAGTQKAHTALITDDQLATRFKPVVLPTWRLNDDLRTLLAGMEKTLPLAEPSNLASEDMIRAMLPKAHETIGGFVTLLQAATVLAIKGGKERIDPKVIDKVDATTLSMLDAKMLRDI